MTHEDAKIKQSDHFTISEMSLRDWFAGMAMQGMLAANSSRTELIDAWEIADAMLKTRSLPHKNVPQG